MLRRSAKVIQTSKPLFIAAAQKSKQFSTISNKASKIVAPHHAAKTANRTKFVRFYAKYPAGISEIAMPALSPTMTAGNITEWKVKVGDKISPGDVLCSVETDKATIDFENQQDGFVAKILLPNGSKEVTIGTPVLLLADSKDDVAKAANIDVSAAPKAAESQPPKQEQTTAAPVQQAPAAAAPQQQQQQQAPATGGRVFATPLAKKVAEQGSIPLANVVGTGPNNRILKADVEEFASTQKAKPTTVATAAPVTSAVSAEFTDIPVSMTRKVIANRLLESKRNIPHYYLTVECQVDALLKIRNQLNKLGETRGFKLSVNDFIVKAAALSMKKVPEVNSSWMGDYIRQYKNADISVAVQTDTGLITPIVSSAEKRGLADISNTVKSLAQRARENKLALHEFQGGSFTISNLGMFGIQEFSAIINPPQSCILAVGSAEKKVVPNEGPDAKETPFKVVTTMKVTMSCDHRVVDGAVGAQWLQAFKENIETPVMLML